MQSYVIDLFACSHTRQHLSDIQALYDNGTMDYDVLASAVKLYKYFASMHHDGYAISLDLPATGQAAQPLWPYAVGKCSCDHAHGPMGLIASPETMATYLLIAVGADAGDEALVHTLLGHYRRAIYCVFAGGAIVLRRDREVRRITAEVFPHLTANTHMMA